MTITVRSEGFCSSVAPCRLLGQVAGNAACCCSLKIHPTYVNGASVNSFECKLHLFKRCWSYPQTRINSFVSVGTSQKYVPG